MREKIHPLPDLNVIIEASRGETPVHESLVLFFERWWSLDRQPQLGEYRLLYVALKELLPKVEWPKEEFKWWVNHKNCALITKPETFHRLYLSRFGPFFEAGEFVKEYENGRGDKYIEKNRKEKKEQRFEDVKNARSANPIATQQQIADVVCITQGRVSQVISEVLAKSEPKLLNVGENQHSARSNANTLKSRGETKDYIFARLKRDGHHELAEKVKSGAISARQAGLQVGYTKQESMLTALKRDWRKANEVERKEFLSWISEVCDG